MCRFIYVLDQLLVGLEFKGAPPPLKTGAHTIWRQCSAVRKWARVLCSHKRALLINITLGTKLHAITWWSPVHVDSEPSNMGH
jgi:hypothetical protein